MDKSMIEEYIKGCQRVSIPEIQHKFSLTYKETKALFQELENDDVIKMEDDFYYTVLSEEDEFFSIDDDDEFTFEFIEGPPSQETILHCVGEDGMEERKARWGKRDGLEDDMLFLEPREVVFERLAKRDKLKKIAEKFDGMGRFIRWGNDYFCELGIAYPDDTEMKFRLSCQDNITLSDCGGTYQYMSKHFAKLGDGIRQQAQKVMDTYGLELKTDGDKSELYIQIHNEKGAIRSLLWLFSAIERITSLPAEEYERLLRDLLNNPEE